MNKKLLVIGAAAALAAQYGSAVYAAQEDGTATALVIEPLTITEDTAMNFGTVAGGENADTIVLGTDGSRTVTGTDAQIIAAGPGNAGQFTVTGEPGQAYSITFSASATMENAAGDSMTVDTFTNNNPSPIDGGGSDTLLVGGRLNVGANQPAGAYSTATGGGSPYTVTVNYN